MATEQLVEELKRSDAIQPQILLKGMTIEQLTDELKDIFEANTAELEDNAQFRNNFTELVNYIYVITLDKEPKQRKKDLFSDKLITFLLKPNPAV